MELHEIGDTARPGAQVVDALGQWRETTGITRIYLQMLDLNSTGESDLRFVAVDTNAPYVLNFDSADGGKINYVWMRWVSPTGERGPWSEQAQAKIAA